MVTYVMNIAWRLKIKIDLKFFFTLVYNHFYHFILNKSAM